MKTGPYPCCLMCNHCENIDLISETGICGPQEGETVYLYSPCCCDITDIRLVESLQAERDAAAHTETHTIYPIRFTKHTSAILPISGSSPMEALAEAKRLLHETNIWDTKDLLLDADEDQTTECTLATVVYVVPGKHHQPILDLVRKLNKVKGLDADLALRKLAPAIRDLGHGTSLAAITATDKPRKYIMLAPGLRSVSPHKEDISPLLVLAGYDRLVTKTISGYEDVTPDSGDIFIFEMPDNPSLPK